MPPDSNKLRQRKTTTTATNDLAATESTEPATETVIKSLQSLSSQQVCIDGVIYSLEGFEHPGGDSILLFGGNDVTVQYQMIHPYHTDKHLEKLQRVGKVVDYLCDYKFDTEFEREMKQEVFKIVRRGHEFGTPGWFFRAACYIAIFFYLEYQFVFYTSIYNATAVGVSMALIGMNVQHDANHGACSKQPWINDFLGLFCDLIGNSKWLWMEKHWTHHAFTNDATKDPDVMAAEPMLLFNDYPVDHPARQWYHQFQTFWLLPALSLYWLSSVFHPQVLDLQDRGAASVGVRMDSAYIKSRVPLATALRLNYLFWNVCMPFYTAGGLNWHTFGLIQLMGVAGSLTLAVLFTLSHNFQDADRDPLAAAGNETKPVCWFKSQVETSCTYGGFISGCLTGGLNFQVEHHLFPRMSSAWYPYIAPTVRKICAKHGVRYAYYPWLWQNIVSTVSYIHDAGSGTVSGKA